MTFNKPTTENHVTHTNISSCSWSPKTEMANTALNSAKLTSFSFTACTRAWAEPHESNKLARNSPENTYTRLSHRDGR